EPLGLAPLEAMARSVPVVAVGEGGVTETVEDGVTGLLVAPESAAMGAAISRLLADATLRRAMGDAGRAHVEASWSVASRTPALEALLAAVAGERVGAAV